MIPPKLRFNTPWEPLVSRSEPPVTIAAGFRFSDGVLLCADTQVQYGDALKAQGSKLFAYDLKPMPVKIAFALAGAVKTAKMAIRQIILAIQDLRDEQLATRRVIIPLIEKCLNEVFTTRVYPHPNYQKQGSPEFYLIIALETPGMDIGLFSTSEDSVDLIEDFDCIGTGDYLFRYLVGPAFETTMSLEKTVILATHALREVKANIPYCGGESEFRIYSTGRLMFSGVAGYDIAHVEKFSRVLQMSMYNLMFAMAELRNDDEAIRKAKQLFEDNLANVRRNYLEDKDHRIAMGKLLKYLSEPGKKKITIQFKR